MKKINWNELTPVCYSIAKHEDKDIGVAADMLAANIHAGGLRYHGMSPIVSQLYHDGYMRAVSVRQSEVFDAAVMFAKCEGILPAPESSHAIRVAIDEALECKKTGKKKTILFGLTGTGYFDLAAYKQYNDKTMTDTIPTDEDLAQGFATIPDIPQNRA